MMAPLHCQACCYNACETPPDCSRYHVLCAPANRWLSWQLGMELCLPLKMDMYRGVCGLLVADLAKTLIYGVWPILPHQMSYARASVCRGWLAGRGCPCVVVRSWHGIRQKHNIYMSPVSDNPPVCPGGHVQHLQPKTLQ